MKRITPVAIFAALIVIVAIMSSCSDDGGSSSPPEPSGTHSLGEIQATVYVGGVVSGASEEEIVVLDILDGQPVKLRLLEANGPAHYFFRQTTNPHAAVTLNQAAPQSGEDVCVLARLYPNGDLVAWKVFLESKCQHQP